MLSFNQVSLTCLCSLKLRRQDFKNSWWSNGKIRFPTKIIYAVHNKLLQISEIKSWISNYEVLFSYVESQCCSSKIRWNNEIKVKKINDRNLDDTFRLILLIYGKNMKKRVKIYAEYFKKLHDKMFRKLNASTEHDLEFLMLLRRNSLQNETFFCKNPQKVIEEYHFLPQSHRSTFSMPFNLTKMV